MAGPLIVFEDDLFRDLFPLTLTRPASDLLCGTMTLEEKLRAGLGGPDTVIHARDYVDLDDRCRAASYAGLFRNHDVLTFVNGRLVFRDGAFEAIDPGWVGKYVSGTTVVLANLPKDRLASLDRCLGAPIEAGVFEGLPARAIEACLVRYPWDLVNLNGEEIANDFRRLGGSGIELDPPPGVFLTNEAEIRIAKDVILSPGVVIDASKGPVNIAGGAVVMANASLAGPLHVGPGSIVKMGARIYGGTSLGPASRVGGEIAESVIQGYSNKQHDGFLGHSYLGEWVNIGAGTETSDMKNNYSTVKVSIGSEPVDSGQVFAGLFMGDHSKSGIGTTFNTGTVVGVCCNVYGAGYPPKHIPSFTWGGAPGFAEHRLEAALATARRAMERRGKALGPRSEAALRKVFALTETDRTAFLGK